MCSGAVETPPNKNKMVHSDTWKDSTRYLNYLEDCWPCAGGLSTVNNIGTQLHETMNSGLTQWRLTVYVNAIAERGRNSVGKQQIQPGCGESADVL